MSNNPEAGTIQLGRFTILWFKRSVHPKSRDYVIEMVTNAVIEKVFEFWPGHPEITITWATKSEDCTSSVKGKMKYNVNLTVSTVSDDAAQVFLPVRYQLSGKIVKDKELEVQTDEAVLNRSYYDIGPSS